MSDLRIPKVDPDADRLAAALAYAEAGWYIAYTDLRSDAKNPEAMGAGWPEKTSRNSETIRSWYENRDDRGIFLHAGRSGAWIADIDRAEKAPDVLRIHAIDNPAVPHQQTRPATDPERGHYVFRQPPGRRLGNSTGKLGGSWGEARGRNGGIAACPTPHPGRGRYQWSRIGTCPVLPADVADLLPDAEDRNDAVDDATLTEFLQRHKQSDRPELLKAVTNAFINDVKDGKARHDAARDCACWAMREAVVGCYPAMEAAKALRDLYVEARNINREGGRPSVGEHTARAEFRSIVAWAIGQVDGIDLADLRDKIEERAPDLKDMSWTGVEKNGQSANSSEQIEAVSLTQCVETFQRWLHLPDPLIVVTTIGAVAANLIPGDPLWLLVVGPPSSAKTETVGALTPLSYVHPAAKVTEAALLSGTPPKERVKAAKGGLLRHIGDFGIMLLKDFTSVLAQNRDARAEALAALREIFDGSWDRPVGTGGGVVLHWDGKCGLIGGCTPTIDRHHAVMGTLGERFLFYRVTVTEPDDQAERRLTSRRHETDMRRELAAAVGGVLTGVNPDANFEADEHEDRWLVSLAVWTAQARTPVERDGYSREVVVMPESEGPARIVTQLGAMRDGLAAIGASLKDRWFILHKLAWDAMPAMRRTVLQTLQETDGWAKRADLMDATGIPQTPVERELEDLVLIGLAKREKAGKADNAPWQYRLSTKAHSLWPKSSPEMLGGVGRDSDKESKTSLNNQQPGVSTFRGSSSAGAETVRQAFPGATLIDPEEPST